MNSLWAESGTTVDTTPEGRRKERTLVPSQTVTGTLGVCREACLPPGPVTAGRENNMSPKPAQLPQFLKTTVTDANMAKQQQSHPGTTRIQVHTQTCHLRKGNLTLLVRDLKSTHTPGLNSEPFPGHQGLHQVPREERLLARPPYAWHSHTKPSHSRTQAWMMSFKGLCYVPEGWDMPSTQ